MIRELLFGNPVRTIFFYIALILIISSEVFYLAKYDNSHFPLSLIAGIAFGLYGLFIVSHRIGEEKKAVNDIDAAARLKANIDEYAEELSRNFSVTADLHSHNKVVPVLPDLDREEHIQLSSESTCNFSDCAVISKHNKVLESGTDDTDEADILGAEELVKINAAEYLDESDPIPNELHETPVDYIGRDEHEIADNAPVYDDDDVMVGTGFDGDNGKEGFADPREENEDDFR